MEDQTEQRWSREEQGDERCINGARPEAERVCTGRDARLIQRVREAADQTGDLRAAVVIALLATALLRPTDLPRLQIEHLVWDGPEVVIHGPGPDRTGLPIRLSRQDSALLADYLAERINDDGTLPTHGPLLVGERGALTRATIYTIVNRVMEYAALTSAERQQVTPTAFRMAALRAGLTQPGQTVGRSAAPDA